MTYSDEMLMAYVDHELDAATTASIDAAIARDAGLAGRVERQRRLADAVHAAYEPVLQEPMPKRLLDAAGGTASATATSRAPRRWASFEWSAMAASVALGIVIGVAFIGDGRRGSPNGDDDLVAAQGRILVRGALARALSDQLASTQKADAPVRIGLTFASKDGGFCRTFVLERGGSAGLACGSGGDWQVHVLARGEPKSGAYRTAATELPATIQQAVDERIQGTSLDAAAEQAARQRGWKR